MIEISFQGSNSKSNYKGLHGLQLSFSPFLVTGLVGAEISSRDNQKEIIRLTIDTKGFFSLIVDSQPIDLFIDGNLLTEAEDPGNIQFFEYIWNPMSKILTGRVQI